MDNQFHHPMLDRALQAHRHRSRRAQADQHLLPHAWTARPRPHSGGTVASNDPDNVVARLRLAAGRGLDRGVASLPGQGRPDQQGLPPGNDDLRGGLGSIGGF